MYIFNTKKISEIEKERNKKKELLKKVDTLEKQNKEKDERIQALETTMFELM